MENTSDKRQQISEELFEEESVSSVIALFEDIEKLVVAQGREVEHDEDTFYDCAEDVYPQMDDKAGATYRVYKQYKSGTKDFIGYRLKRITEKTETSPVTTEVFQLQKKPFNKWGVHAKVISIGAVQGNRAKVQKVLFMRNALLPKIEEVANGYKQLLERTDSE